MFRKLTLPAVLLLAAVSGPVSSSPSSALLVPSEVQFAHATADHSLSTPREQGSVAARVRLDAGQMREVRGSGWLKKIWRAFKRAVSWIFRNCRYENGQVTCTVVNMMASVSEVESTTETTEYVATLAGNVTETYASTETTDTYYDTDADYDAGISSGSSYSDSGWDMTGSYSEGGGDGGCEGGGGDSSLAAGDECGGGSEEMQ